MMQIVSYSENSATARAVNGGRAGCEMMLTDVPVDDDASTRSAQYVFKFPNGARFAYSSDIQL